MSALHSIVNRILRREEGQTLSEYGLIMFFLVIAVAGAVTLLGESIIGIWNTVSEMFSG